MSGLNATLLDPVCHHHNSYMLANFGTTSGKEVVRAIKGQRLVKAVNITHQTLHMREFIEIINSGRGPLDSVLGSKEDQFETELNNTRISEVNAYLSVFKRASARPYPVSKLEIWVRGWIRSYTMVHLVSAALAVGRMTVPNRYGVGTAFATLGAAEAAVRGLSTTALTMVAAPLKIACSVTGTGLKTAGKVFGWVTGRGRNQ